MTLSVSISMHNEIGRGQSLRKDNHWRPFSQKDGAAGEIGRGRKKKMATYSAKNNRIVANCVKVFCDSYVIFILNFEFLSLFFFLFFLVLVGYLL